MCIYTSRIVSIHANLSKTNTSKIVSWDFSVSSSNLWFVTRLLMYRNCSLKFRYVNKIFFFSIMEIIITNWNMYYRHFVLNSVVSVKQRPCLGFWNSLKLVICPLDQHNQIRYPFIKCQLMMHLMVWLFYFILGNKHSCHGLYILKQPTRKHNSSKQIIGYFSSWNRFCYFYVKDFEKVYVK